MEDKLISVKKEIDDYKKKENVKISKKKKKKRKILDNDENDGVKK